MAMLLLLLLLLLMMLVLLFLLLLVVVFVLAIVLVKHAGMMGMVMMVVQCAGAIALPIALPAAAATVVAQRFRADRVRLDLEIAHRCLDRLRRLEIKAMMFL